MRAPACSGCTQKKNYESSFVKGFFSQKGRGSYKNNEQTVGDLFYFVLQSIQRGDVNVLGARAYHSLVWSRMDELKICFVSARMGRSPREEREIFCYQF